MTLIEEMAEAIMNNILTTTKTVPAQTILNADMAARSVLDVIERRLLSDAGAVSKPIILRAIQAAKEGEK